MIQWVSERGESLYLGFPLLYNFATVLASSGLRVLTFVYGGLVAPVRWC